MLPCAFGNGLYYSIRKMLCQALLQKNFDIFLQNKNGGAIRIVPGAFRPPKGEKEENKEGVSSGSARLRDNYIKCRATCQDVFYKKYWNKTQYMGIIFGKNNYIY